MLDPADLARQDQVNAEAAALVELWHKCPDCGGKASVTISSHSDGTREVNVWLTHQTTCPNAHGENLRWDIERGQAR